MSAWATSKCRIITEAELMLEGPIKGELTLEEVYRSARAVALCKVCGCLRLKRELVETRIMGVRCIDEKMCMRRGEVDHDDGRGEATTRAERPKWHRTGTAPKVDVASTWCRCGKCSRLYNPRNWELLTLVDASDEEQGDLVIHSVTKRCLCGESLRVTSERLRGTSVYVKAGAP